MKAISYGCPSLGGLANHFDALLAGSRFVGGQGHGLQ
jgi:hypothetical protein